MTTSVSTQGLRWKLLYGLWLILIVAALIASMWLPETEAVRAAVRGACVLFLIIKADQRLARRANTIPLF